jgi:hypothetical protein
LDGDDVELILSGDVPYIRKILGRPAERSAGAIFSVDYSGGTPVVIRDTPQWDSLPASPDSQPAADNAPVDHMGPMLVTDTADIDITELIADLTAVVISADAGELGRQPALLAALQRAVVALQSVA